MVPGSGSVLWGGAQEQWFGIVSDLERATPWAHTPARLFAEYGVVVFAGLLVCSWWLARADGEMSRVAAALWAPVGALVALGVNQLLVAAVAEPRPYTVSPRVAVLVSRSGDYSFPSDHAVMAGAVAVGVLVVNRRLGIVAAGLALAMAFTRVYVGAHFPLDVAVGLLLGAVLAGVSHLLVRPVLVRMVTRLSGTPLRPFLTARVAR